MPKQNYANSKTEWHLVKQKRRLEHSIRPRVWASLELGQARSVLEWEMLKVEVSVDVGDAISSDTHRSLQRNFQKQTNSEPLRLLDQLRQLRFQAQQHH